MPDVDTIKAAAGWLLSHTPPWQALLAGGAALAVLVGVTVLIRALRRLARALRRPTPAATNHDDAPAARKISRVQRGLTMLLVALGLGFDAQGNYNAFSQIHSMNAETRNVLFLFLPLFLVVCAVGARHNYLSTPEGEKPSLGFEGQVMWGIAILSAGFAATAATDFTDVVARLLIPPITAWVLKRLIKGEYAALHGLNTNQLRGMFSSAWEAAKRKLIRWGWMSAEHTSLQEEERDRRVMRLAPLAYRMHMLPAGSDEKAASEAKWIEEINKSANSWLMKDPEAIAQMQRQLAGMYQSIADTSPKAVERMNPWNTPSTPVETAAPAPTLSGEAAEDAAIEKARKTVSAAVSATPKPKTAVKAATKPAAGGDAYTVMRDLIAKAHQAGEPLPSLRELDEAAGTNGRAKQIRKHIYAELEIEVPVKEVKAS